MLIIPAIDLIEGSCVRLTRGKYRLKKEYSEKPLDVAKKWKECGASWLHIVDLDGARTGNLNNLDIAVKIRDKTGLKVQYGGGIRSTGKIDSVINRGIDRAIIGTAALEDKMFFDYVLGSGKHRCILSIDFRKDGTIYKRGWQENTNFNIFDFLPGLKGSSIDQIIVTNISRDGTLEGLDIDLIDRVLKVSPAKLIIAGGISGIGDIIKLKEKKRVNGVIIGKALYEGKIDLKKAIELARSK